MSKTNYKFNFSDSFWLIKCLLIYKASALNYYKKQQLVFKIVRKCYISFF